MNLRFFKDPMKKKLPAIKRRSQEWIPFVFTFANAFFGFYSIIKTIEGNFVAAALCIMMAALMDGFDGRLARYWGTTGPLGSELDSLCDAVSFCLAPAVLMYSWYLHDFGHVGFFISVLTLYVCAGLLRLARFNIITSDQSIFFLGLPTTIAAFFIAQLILYQEWVSESPLDNILTERVLVGLVACIALLMISSLQFPAFKTTKVSFRKLSTYVKGLLLLCITLWCYIHGYPLVLLIVAGYIIGGLCFNAFSRAKQVVINRRK